MKAPFLLVGEDCDGDSREFWYQSIEQARKTAVDCTRTDASGPAWRSWEIWGNDPITEEWRALETSNQNAERNNMKPHFNGPKLLLPEWTFSIIRKDARVPHRSRTLAFHREGNTQYFVCANYKQTLFWVKAIAPGFAGDRSRASLTCSTRSRTLADLWVKAVEAGNVGIA